MFSVGLQFVDLQIMLRPRVIARFAYRGTCRGVTSKRQWRPLPPQLLGVPSFWGGHAHLRLKSLTLESML